MKKPIKQIHKSLRSGNGTLLMGLMLIVMAVMLLGVVTVRSVTAQRQVHIQTMADVIADGVAEYARNIDGTVDADKAAYMTNLLVSENHLEAEGLSIDVDETKFADSDVQVTISGEHYGNTFNIGAITHIFSSGLAPAGLGGIASIEAADGTMVQIAYPMNGVSWVTYDNSAEFGGTGTRHGGIDIQAAFGTGIVTAAAGTVSVAGWHDSYGNYVVVDHGHGVSTCYAHMAQIAGGVYPGKRVEAGELIGYVGSTGNSTGPHLHFEVRNSAAVSASVLGAAYGQGNNGRDSRYVRGDPYSANFAEIMFRNYITGTYVPTTSP